MTDRYCVHCFDNPEVKSWIGHHAEKGYCEFCRKQSAQTVAAEDFFEALLECVYTQYSTPEEDGMTYITAEGGWVGETYESDVVLDALELATDDETRLEPIAAFLDDHSWAWCDADHRHFNPGEQSLADWQQFCRLTKHRIRYMFLQEEREGLTERHGQEYHVREILRSIGRAIYDNELVSTIKAGTPLYRVRTNKNGKGYTKLADLAGPKPEDARFSNRMSPAGISMLYAAFDQETAMAETLQAETPFTVAKLALTRDIDVVDFARLPTRHSLLLGLMPYGHNTFFQDQRHQINFLHRFVHDLSKPVTKDGVEHFEYVPTQIVTEYIRHLYALEHDETRTIMGVVYTSAQSANLDRNAVFFVDAIDTNATIPNKHDASHYFKLLHATPFKTG